MLTPLQRYARPLLAFLLVSAGITHFIAPGQFVPSVPAPFPAYPTVIATGIIELLAAVGLYIGRWRRITAYLTMAYLIAILPAHFQMLILNEPIFGISGRGFFTARIFLQLLPILLAWWSRQSPEPSIFPALDRFEAALMARWQQPYAWHSQWLWAAAWYNLGFGFWVVLFPDQAFALFDMPPAQYPFIWQSVGMIVGVYGLGYAFAALDEQREWIVVMVGWLGKLFGPIGFIYTFALGDLPLAFGTILLFNDLIWYPSFFGIMWRKFRSLW